MNVTPTQEQKIIIDAPETPLTLIQAYAGTGKTTTLRMIAEHQPLDRKILYVCFGKENQLETERKFQHLTNVRATTFDGFTYQLFQETRRPAGLNKWVVSREFYMKPDDAQEIVEKLNLFLDDPKILSTRGKSQELWKKLMNGETEFTNFAYLRKRFLLQVLKNKGWTEGFDLLLVDECQDLNPVMLESLLLFQGPKIFVGDRFQHIFSFLGTVDTFQRLDSELDVVRWTLSKSFRFGQNIADMASKVANSMFYQKPKQKVQVIGNQERGLGKITFYDSKRDTGLPEPGITILAVKNQTLLKLVFDAAEKNKKLHVIGRQQFFSVLEREFENYLSNGAAYIEEKRNIAEWNEDSEMTGVYSTILSYGKSLPKKIRNVKQSQVPVSDAEYVFCTIHKSKGLEFDKVKLLDDLEVGKRGREKNAKELLESMDEKNRLYYVGTTRAKYEVFFPLSLCKEFSLDGHKIAKPIQRIVHGIDVRMKVLSATKVIDI